MYIQLVCCVVGSFLILFSSFWFRTQLRDISNSEQFRQPLYNEIVLIFLDATGYRYVMNQERDHQIFQAISILKRAQELEPQNTFFQKTKAVPPSTDFTILSIINGIKQMQNNLDVIFKSNPAPFEDSLLKKKLKTALYSSKKQDWLRMTSGDFSYIENPQFFTVDNIKIADVSSYSFFKNQFLSKQYQLYVLHMMGFDALGHALQYQDYDKGIELLKMFNQIIEGTLSMLQDDQLLIIIGDHDQSKRGKHYQCSEESFECEGFIFAYNKKGLQQNVHIYQTYEPTDLSATISSIFGFQPIEQNLGKIIPQFYPFNTQWETISKDQEMIKAQVLTYLEKQGSKISDQLIQEIKQLPAEEAVAQVQRNLFIGMPSKSQFIVGLSFIIFGIYSFRQFWGLRELASVSLTGMFGSSILIFGIVTKIVLKFKESNLINTLYLSGVLIIFLLNQLNLIPEICYMMEFQFLLVCMIKYFHYKTIGQIQDWKIFILLVIALISQILVFVFFVLNQSEFELKRTILFCQIAVIIFLCLIDPRIFNKGKIKILYLTIMFILSDIIVIFQLNVQKNFIQFLLFYLGMQINNTQINIILAKIIYDIYNPIRIQHQIFKDNYPVNMNSMIILTQEFEIGPSLFSVFIGNFGLQLTGICTLLFNKGTKEKIETLSALFVLCFGKLIQDSLQLLNYTQSIHNTDEQIEIQIARINSIPLKLVELILYSLAILLIVKKDKQLNK